MDLLGLAIGSIFVQNVILAQFLGICSFLGISKSVKNAFGMGLAVIFVVFMAGIVTYGLYYGVLAPLNIPYMDLIVFIFVIAALVQFVEMIMKKYMVALYKALGIYLPLITTNCAVLGVSLYNIKAGFTFAETVVYSLAIPIGYTLAIVLLATMRERLDNAPIPAPFKGTALALIMAAIMSLAFMGLKGIV